MICCCSLWLVQVTPDRNGAGSTTLFLLNMRASYVVSLQAPRACLFVGTCCECDMHLIVSAAVCYFLNRC
jgi:hypothetical protein